MSILDEVGRLAAPVTASDSEEWANALHSGAAGPAAPLNALRLGEYRLAIDQRPDAAAWLFALAGRLSRPGSEVRGLAVYDTALARFYQGAYAEAASRFRALLGSRRLRGASTTRCALWYRHAAACAGYHAQHAALGIPEPPVLDPFCGAAALASILRADDMPFGRKTVLAACRVGGEGSSTADLVAAAAKLGLRGRLVTADEAGLRALPKPVVAYVERDHFVSVVRADRRGVSYLCSDCGPWPGGRVSLSWKQWRALDPGLYVTAYAPGTTADAALGQALGGRRARGVRLASVGPVRLRGLQRLVAIERLLSLLAGHVVAYLPTTPATCGGKPDSLHCPFWILCPMDHNGSGDCFGPCTGDPVDLATGEEEYRPSPDLIVYNPAGPSVIWRRAYNSLRSPLDAGYQDTDFGVGWTHAYNVAVYDVQIGGSPLIGQGATM